MAERPDLEYYVPRLATALKGRTITAVEVKKPVILRLAVEGDPASLLVGRTFLGATRRGHFVLFDLGELEMIVAPMLAGRFLFGEKLPRDTAMVWTLDDERKLIYRDDVQMGKVYVVKKGDWKVVAGIEPIGIDVLSPKFTRDALAALMKKRREQIRVFLMDKKQLDAFGNAYADEVLFEAGIHPKTMIPKLDDDDITRLHKAIVMVMRTAIDTIEERQPPLDEKLRDFLKVRNRHGEVCPRCGGKIRRAGVHGHDTFYCPSCQPETRKSGIVRWG